jgi:hypothetical protein
MEPHIANEKMLQMKTRQSLTLSGPKNDGIESKVVRTQETMLLNTTRRLKTLRTRLRWSRVRGHPYRGKVAATDKRRLRNFSGQESAELEPEVV